MCYLLDVCLVEKSRNYFLSESYNPSKHSRNIKRYRERNIQDRFFERKKPTEKAECILTKNIFALKVTPIILTDAEQDQ